MKTALEPSESVVKEGRANLQRGVETVGGHAYLTSRRLIFESHSFNIQRGATVVDLGEVTQVGKAWTKFLNAVPLSRNSVSVETADGQELRMVCSKTGAWVVVIRIRSIRRTAERRSPPTIEGFL